jgi:hypothetical protein
MKGKIINFVFIWWEMQGWFDYASNLVTTAASKIEEATKPGVAAKPSSASQEPELKEAEASASLVDASVDEKTKSESDKTLFASTLEKTSETGREMVSKLSSLVNKWTTTEPSKEQPPAAVSATSPEQDK